MDVLPLGLTGDGALRAAVAADREVTRMEGARLDHLAQYLLEAAQAWVPPRVSVPGGEELVALGGPGAPRVPELTVCEVAAALALGQPAATSLCADVLDLSCRLPRVAAAVRCGDLPFARARVIARRTRELSAEQAGLVDARLVQARHTGRGPLPVVALVPTSRLRALVDQAVLTVRGPQTAEEAEAAVAASLYVDVVHEAGGATDLAARLAAGDAARLDARLSEIAGWLADVGDDRPCAVLRAVALGLLADPALLDALHEVRRDRVVDEQGRSGSSGASDRRAGDVHATAPDDGDRSHVQGRACGAAGAAGLPPALLDGLVRSRSTVLYVHLDRASGTWCEERAGALSPAQAREIVGHSAVTVRPVLDLAEPLTYTGYVAPPRLREQLALLNAGYCTFPFCQRRARAADVDHRTPYRVTRTTSTLGTHKLCRKHHRAKDKGGWRVASPAPGIWLWRSPAGACWLVTNGVTAPLNGIHDPVGIGGRAVDASELPGSHPPTRASRGSVTSSDRTAPCDPGPTAAQEVAVRGSSWHDVTVGFVDTG
ncbi:DUF222 domain-containing protein [Actinotalea caeni]|uniref:DUF222 domain-containing protein n=1 Tax=Actinotalea caeni TaxID=1348467 RepID=UPI0012E0D3E3|nr:DUF222 domain-containing protein [Actinotalea caeni]